MPNPFDLPGPEFLVFYVGLGVVVTLVIAGLRQRSDPAVDTTLPLTDYLKIAYLRGGPEEALRVATVALLDRGLVERVDEHHVKATASRMPAGLQRTEQRVIESCTQPTRASAIVEDTSLQMTVTSECEGQLVRAGLLPDVQAKAARLSLLVGGTFLLGLVALGKIVIAFSRGRTNVGLLVVASLVFAYVLYRVTNPARTSAGEAMLADLRRLFSALKDRAASIGTPSGTNEMALLAAVFGVGSLPERGYFEERLFRKPEPRTSSSAWGWGGSCGSAGGSSCGSSCGSGCGGGGGGCGGCGS